MMFKFVIFLLLGGLGYGLYKNNTPSDVGMIEGKFTPCPNKPNCVNSQCKEGMHFIEPLPAKWEELKELIYHSQEYVVKKEEANYLHAVAITPTLRFKDDVQFYFSAEEKVIHVKSQSRVGYRDFDVNRNRIETLRTNLKD